MVNLTLEAEPSNPADKNAILVNFDGNPIGYIPSAWIEAMHKAIKDDTITSLSVQIRRNVFSLFSIFNVNSSQKFPKPNKNYLYGQVLN